MKNRISRRQFLSTSAATPVALAVATQLTSSHAVAAANPGKGAWVRWLDDRAPATAQGVTWGTPWPRGVLKSARDLALRDAAGKVSALQSWPLAFWPDGSLKWTGHALAPAADIGNGPFEVVAGKGAKTVNALTIRETDAHVEIDTGKFVCRLPREGAAVIASIQRDGREQVRDGKLVLLRQDRPNPGEGVTTTETFVSAIEKLTLEHRGNARAVVKIEGKHAGAGR
ncbi:MAG: twin-arginine translocation signal domain-containing protein, partial [Steroidobacteraceae bacterium]|nr:twin-arginine translocation signal domain-containing protein [Steroidobacteraceae bacterium]